MKSLTSIPFGGPIGICALFGLDWSLLVLIWFLLGLIWSLLGIIWRYWALFGLDS